MFIGQKYDFQTKHIESLLHKCEEHEELVLSAPTGSGKTVMVARFITRYLDEKPNTVFLWLSPGAGGLESSHNLVFAKSRREFQMETYMDLSTKAIPVAKCTL